MSSEKSLLWKLMFCSAWKMLCYEQAQPISDGSGAAEDQWTLCSSFCSLGAGSILLHCWKAKLRYCMVTEMYRGSSSAVDSVPTVGHKRCGVVHISLWKTVNNWHYCSWQTFSLCTRRTADRHFPYAQKQQMQILVSCNLWYFVCVYTVFANTRAAVAILVLIAQK